MSLKKSRVVTTWDSIIHATLPESIPYMEESKYSTAKRLAEVEIQSRKEGEIKDNQISCGKWKKIVERISLSPFIVVIMGVISNTNNILSFTSATGEYRCENI